MKPKRDSVTMATITIITSNIQIDVEVNSILRMSPLAILLIIIDACCNILSDLFWSQGRLLDGLYVYLGHDMTLLLSLLYTLLQLINDDVLRQRMLTPVLIRYWTRPARTMIYLCLTISWQVVSNVGVYPRLGECPRAEPSSSSVFILFHYCCQRFGSLVYYYTLSRPLHIKQYLAQNIHTPNNRQV